MTPQRYQQVKRVFAEVCHLDPAQRAARLDEVCAGDAELRAEVQALLDHDEKSLPVQPLVSAAALGLGQMDAGQGSSALAGLEPLPEKIPERIGQYRIARRIGQGGMGVVYEAEQDNPRRTIALKVIRPGVATDQVLRRFKFEAHVLGRLQHPGIAQVYEAGTAEVESPGGASLEQPYFAMELIRGKPLGEFAGEGNLGTRRRLELFVKICDAVHHAHQKGVIHRDLKPGNILVDESGQPKILDFGVARVTDSDVQVTTLQTDVGQLIGTLPYMSPEQIAGDSRELDTRSDVYALGVVCYQLLTGKLPHQLAGKTIPEAARTITEEDPVRLSSCNPVFRGDLDTVVGKALEKEKDRRYQSATEFAADVRRYLNDEPIAARPASTLYQFRKFARRNRALVGGVAGIFLVLVAGTIVSATQAVRATRAERLAEDRLQQTTDALNLAEQRRAEAETEAAKAEAVGDFLVQMFESVDPEVIQGYDVALLKLLLGEAADRVDTEFAEQPEVRATLQDTIGWVYHNIGLRDKAEPHLLAAHDLRREILGDDDPETLSSASHVYSLRWSQAHFEEAKTLCRQVIEARRRVLGEYHLQTLESRYDLAGILRELDRIDEAEAELKDVMQAAREHLGEDADLTLQTLNGLGAIYLAQRRYQEAIPVFREVLDGFRIRRGEQHPATLAVLMNLASALHHSGALDEAESLHRHTLELSGAIHGEDHPSTIQVAINLAGMLTTRGRPAEAEQVARDAIERSLRANGREHPDTFRAMTNLGIALRQQGKLDQATTCFQDAIALAGELFGQHAPERINLMNSFAGVLYQQGKLDQAEEIVRQVVEGRAARYGDDHFETLSAMNNLGLLLIERQKLTEAEELFARLIELGDQAAPPGHWFPANARKAYGRALALQQRHADAEPVLLEAYEGLNKALGERHPRTLDTIGYLIELYNAWGKPEQAAEWQAKLPTPQPADVPASP